MWMTCSVYMTYLTYLFTWLSDLPVVRVNRWVCWWEHCWLSSLWMTCSVYMTYLTYLFTWLRDLPVVLVNRWVCWWGHCRLRSLWMTCCVFMTCQQCQVDAVLPGLSPNMHDMSHLHLSTFSPLCATIFLRLTELTYVLRPLIIACPARFKRYM